MTLRSSERVVSFRHAFSLPNVDRRLPPGDYRVLSEQESIDGISFLAYRTTSVSIEVPLNTDATQWVSLQSTESMEVVQIDAVELEAVLELDRHHGLTGSVGL